MTFNYFTTAQRVTSREVAAIRLAPDYAALVEHFGLTADSTSGDITDAARRVVVDGAPQSARVDVDMLKGTDPGDVKHRVYWKAARAVRIGLVSAIAKGADEEAKPATLRVSLSGEGGGSSVVPMDSELGQAILKFLSDEN